MNNPLSGTDPTGYVPVIPVIIWAANAYAAYETANETVDAVEDYQNGEISVSDVAATIATSAVENTIGKKVKIAKEGVQKIRKAFKGDKPDSNHQKSQNASNNDGGSKDNGAESNQSTTSSSNQKTTDIGDQQDIASNSGRGKQVGDMISTDGSTKASDIRAKSEEVGFKATQTENGPLKMVDENDVARVTIKGGSERAPGSTKPHVELKDSKGQRVNPKGETVTRRSPENHTPIINDLENKK